MDTVKTILFLNLLVLITAKQYYFKTDAKVNWYTAFQNCAAAGLRLATINSAAEEADLENQMTTNGLQATWMWTSGTDQATGGQQPLTFVWFSTGKPFTFTKWTAREPDNLGGNELCVHVWPQNGQIGWNDWQCTQLLNYICEDTPCNNDNNNHNGNNGNCGCNASGSNPGLVGTLLNGLL